MRLVLLGTVYDLYACLLKLLRPLDIVLLVKTGAELYHNEYLLALLGSGYIAAKINSLNDPAVIAKLIEASQAGVKVELIVRGLCCLIAGVPGFTDNISIRSIVGRFLEHSRIFIFGKDGRSQKIYIGSADYMSRNTVRRVEVAAPVEDERLKKRIREHKNNTKSLIGRALHKYGEENFVWVVLEECDSREQLDEREIYWIKTLNTKAPNGYNLTDGGEGVLGFHLSFETRAKIAASNKGKSKNF